MSYRIKRVAHLTGINPATLRAWERRYGLVAPDRTLSGYRMYSDEDVAMLSRIKALVDEGLAIGEAIARVRRGPEPLPVDGAGPRVADVRARLLDALMGLDRRAALAAYGEVEGLPPERRVDEVLLPVMRQVGNLWETGRASVADEHFAASFVRGRLVGLLEGLDTGAARGPECLCAGAPGELHEFGLMGAAIHLATRGWRTLYVGADLPVDDIAAVAAARRPAMLATSVVVRQDGDAFGALARALRAAAPAGTTVVIGGPGIPDRAAVPEGVHLAHDFADLLRAAPHAAAA